MNTNRAHVVEAATALGWTGDPIGPVEFGGVRFWAIAAEGSETDRQVRLLGCLVCGPPGPAVQDAASLLAPYAPRAVMIDDVADVTQLLVDAALLDQGLVEVSTDGTVRCLAAAGPRTSAQKGSAREQRLLDQITAAQDESTASADDLLHVDVDDAVDDAAEGWQL